MNWEAILFPIYSFQAEDDALAKSRSIRITYNPFQATFLEDAKQLIHSSPTSLLLKGRNLRFHCGSSTHTLIYDGGGGGGIKTSSHVENYRLLISMVVSVYPESIMLTSIYSFSPLISLSFSHLS